MEKEMLRGFGHVERMDVDDNLERGNVRKKTN